MSEKFPPSSSSPEKESNPFRKGALVRFRDDLDPELQEVLKEAGFDLDVNYRVFYFIPADDEGGDAVGLGGADATPREIEIFDPNVYRDDVENGRMPKREIIPVLTQHLRLLS